MRHALTPFQGTVGFELTADISVQDSTLHLDYQLTNSELISGLPSKSFAWDESGVPRKDQLWTTTCFEAFLRPVGLAEYFEINIALTPAWNAYEFTSYRSPQPPKASELVNLKSLTWSSQDGHLKAVLNNKTKYSSFEVSLTAVIEEKNGSKHYLALVHSEAKPDFHAPKSFCLRCP